MKLALDYVMEKYQDSVFKAALYILKDEGALLAEVLRLPKKCRIIIHLFYYEDYSIKEIARLLDIKENTVKSQLNRGRNILKKRVEAA